MRYNDHDLTTPFYLPGTGMIKASVQLIYDGGIL